MSQLTRCLIGQRRPEFPRFEAANLANLASLNDMVLSMGPLSTATDLPEIDEGGHIERAAVNR